MTMNLKEISRTSNVGIAGKWIFRVDTTNFSTCHNDYAMACESDPFCSCSTPDPQQKCICTDLKEDIPQCSYVPVTTPTTPTTNFSTCHNDYAMACESDPFCSCSTPDPQQKCICTDLKEDIPQCSYVPVTTPTTPTTNFSTCHNDYAMACESDPFCSCSTPDPQQKCICTDLKEDIPQCSYVPVTTPTTPTTEGFNGSSYPLASDEIVISAAAFFSWLMVVTELHTA
jgi:hypothetical protein